MTTDDRTPLSALQSPEAYIAHLEADTRFRLDAAARTPALDCADLWALFQSDKDVAWQQLRGLNEGQLVVQAHAMAAHLTSEERIVSGEAVLARWQEGLARRADRQQPAPATDPTIPAAGVILDRARERGELARQHGDFQGARQLDRLRMNVARGAVLRWLGGDLLIQSINTPGAVYSVNRAGCTCPNGAAGRSQCWHVALHDLLVELQEDATAAADILVDAAALRAECEPEPPPAVPVQATLAQRIAAARSRVMQEAA